MESQSDIQTITKLPQNQESALCYLGGWLTGLIFLLLSKRHPITRLHALQSLIVFISLLIVYLVLTSVPLVGRNLLPLWWLISFVLWLVFIVAAYQEHDIILPITKKWAK